MRFRSTGVVGGLLATLFYGPVAGRVEAIMRRRRRMAVGSRKKSVDGESAVEAGADRITDPVTPDLTNAVVVRDEPPAQPEQAARPLTRTETVAGRAAMFYQGLMQLSELINPDDGEIQEMSDLHTAISEAVAAAHLAKLRTAAFAAKARRQFGE